MAMNTGFLLAIILGLAAIAKAEEPRSVQLIKTPTFLLPPETLVALQPSPSISPRWTFESQTKDTAFQLLSSLNLSESSQAELAKPEKWNMSDFGIQFSPSTDFIRALTTEQRQRIYGELAKSDLNPYHRKPLLFGRDVTAWFSNSRLSPNVIAEIDRLSYPRGKVRAFSDVSTLLALMNQNSQEAKLIQILYGHPSWVVSVAWPKDQPLADWLNYWTTNGHNQGHTPYLEAIRTDEDMAVDLLHLLPPNPKKRLNTWPSLSAGLDGLFPNSFSSALRFFQSGAPDSSIPKARALQLLERDYTQIEPPYRFGDVLLLRRGAESLAVHACVYVAEDLVFTKVSREVMRPWVLMSLEDLRPFFETRDGPPAQIEAWRKRPRQTFQ